MTAKPMRQSDIDRATAARDRVVRASASLYCAMLDFSEAMACFDMVLRAWVGIEAEKAIAKAKRRGW